MKAIVQMVDQAEFIIFVLISDSGKLHILFGTVKSTKLMGFFVLCVLKGTFLIITACSRLVVVFFSILYYVI